MYRVDDNWQIPPPIPSITFPPEYTAASLYPCSMVLSPTILLYENVSPGNIIVPFIFSDANSKFVLLFLLLASYLVVNVPNLLGNASFPSFANVTSGILIFNGIIYSFLFFSYFFFG